MDASRELGEKRCSVYLLVILPDQAFAVAGQVCGDGGQARGRVLRNVVCGWLNAVLGGKDSITV